MTRLVALEIIHQSNPVEETQARRDDIAYIETEAQRCTRDPVNQLAHVCKLHKAVVDAHGGIDDVEVVKRALREWKGTAAPGL